MKIDKKYFLCDFDLTIADSSNSAYICANSALKKLGFKSASKSEVRKTIGLSLEKTFLTLTNSKDLEKASEFQELFIKRSEKIATKEIKLFDGAVSAFEDIIEAGHSLSIVSTKDKATIEAILERDGILNYFDTIIGLREVKKQKPNPEGILLAIKMLNAPGKSCIYVGDSIVDAIAAYNAKIKFVAVLTGNYKRHDFAPFNNIGIINSISELSTLFNH